MSILGRVMEKINTERLPTNTGASFNFGLGSAQPSGQVAQMGAMTSVGWLFAVVSRIAQSVASQEWRLYRTQGGDREEVDSHPAIDLWKSANPFVTREDFLETSQQHMELVGEMWWVLVRNGAGVPVELQVVRPDRMKPVPHPTEFIDHYEYRMGSNVFNLEVEDVIFTRSPSPLDAYRGIGVVQAMMVDLGAERLAAEWMQSFFRNSAEPGGIIQFDQNLQDADFNRLVDRWQLQHKGVANAHRVAILERGKWVDRKLTQRDMQFEQLRKFERDQILGAFGMPLPIMGITESVNRANAEAAEVMYARWLIRPRLMRIRSALNEKLLPRYPDGATLEFDFVDPVPSNREALMLEGATGYEKEVLTLNEARRRYGEDVWPGPEGDERRVRPSPLPMLPPSNPNPGNDEDKAAGGDRAKIEGSDLYDDETDREATRMERGWKRRFLAEQRALVAHLEELEKGIKLALGDVESFDWDWWAKYGEEVVEELAAAYSTILGLELPNLPAPELQRLSSAWAEDRGARLLRIDGDMNLANVTRQRVNMLVSQTIERGDSLQTLQRTLREDFAFSPARARTVARTETANALGQGKRTAAKSEGLTEKRWITSGDDRVNEEICLANEAEGWIPIDQAYQSGVNSIPGHVNCRCVDQYRSGSDIDRLAGLVMQRIVAEVRCPACNRKNGENVALGTAMRCRRCKHEWEV